MSTKSRKVLQSGSSERFHSRVALMTKRGECKYPPRRWPSKRLQKLDAQKDRARGSICIGFVKLHIHFWKFARAMQGEWNSALFRKKRDREKERARKGGEEREKNRPVRFTSARAATLSNFSRRFPFSRLLGAHGNHFAHDNVLLVTIPELKKCPRESPRFYD